MQKCKNILCVVIPDSTGCDALKRAVVLAENNQACLTVVEVIDQMPRITKLIDQIRLLEKFQAKVVAGNRQELEEMVAPWRKNIEIQTKVLIGSHFWKLSARFSVTAMTW